jgi:hypothetical protein
MIYIIVNFFIVSFSSFISSYRLSRLTSLVLLTFLIVLIALLPALQYAVGADYGSYIEIFNSSVSIETYYRKGELSFYYLVKVLNYFNAHEQFLFVSTSILSSVMLVNVFRKLKFDGYRLGLLIFCFLVLTNMLHNQMNVIRTYLAVYAFLNAMLYRVERKWLLTIIFWLFAVMSHQSAWLVTPLIFIPLNVYEWLVKWPKFIYSSFSSLYVFGVPFYFLDFVVLRFAPFYSHYLEVDIGSTGILGVLTKVIYLPFHIFFIYLLCSKSIIPKKPVEFMLIGVWLIVANFYFLFLYWGHFFRAYHYFVFFSIIPIYYVAQYFKRKVVMFSLIAVYILAPYLAKVLLFPKGEYTYQSIIFE